MLIQPCLPLRRNSAASVGIPDHTPSPIPHEVKHVTDSKQATSAPSRDATPSAFGNLGAVSARTEKKERSRPLLAALRPKYTGELALIGLHHPRETLSSVVTTHGPGQRRAKIASDDQAAKIVLRCVCQLRRAAAAGYIWTVAYRSGLEP